VGYDARVDEGKDISLLLRAGGQARPDAFAPSQAGLAAGALRHATINDRMANVSLRAVVGRLDRRIAQEPGESSAACLWNRRASVLARA